VGTPSYDFLQDPDCLILTLAYDAVSESTHVKAVPEPFGEIVPLAVRVMLECLSVHLPKRDDKLIQ